ncbi:hypothetical protein Srufu_079120 (plasmid) [Streptomyces libani subsp. rufus]|nr:hypothetical protein Srufu_079120 [Streptomyces libani subsp. rufus]
MALSNFSPMPVTSDLVSFDEAVLMLKGTPYPASRSTIKRWAKRYRMACVRIDRKDHVSFSDVLEAQRDEYARMLAEAHQR